MFSLIFCNIGKDNAVNLELSQIKTVLIDLLKIRNYEPGVSKFQKRVSEVGYR